MFNQQEVILIVGLNLPIDLKDLWKHTDYNREVTITAFWKLSSFVVDVHPLCGILIVIGLLMQMVQSFDQDQQWALLRFMTSCSRSLLL
jgi:hypothetical protein